MPEAAKPNEVVHRAQAYSWELMGDVIWLYVWRGGRRVRVKCPENWRNPNRRLHPTRDKYD